MIEGHFFEVLIAYFQSNSRNMTKKIVPLTNYSCKNMKYTDFSYKFLIFHNYITRKKKKNNNDINLFL